MAKRFDLLVFDWDGTLVDSTGVIVSALKAACRDLGEPEPDDRDAQYVIGLGLSDALRHVAPKLTEDRIPLMVDRYRHHYLSADRQLRPFDGIIELITELSQSGIALAVATGKSRAGLRRALEASGLEDFFLATRCADECFSKPHPQMLEELIDEFAVDRARALMVGDTTHDLLMAANAGVPSLAVTYGAHPANELQALNPLACVCSVSDLRDWLLSNT